MAIELKRYEIEERLNKAVEKVKQLLGAEKAPQLAGDVHHEYEDKYLLVERATNLAACAQLNCLGLLGMSKEQLQTLRTWAAGQEVSLRFKSKETCAFLREETREEEAPRKAVEEVTVGGVLRSAITSKVVTKITEYFWNFEANFTLEAFKGVGADASDRLTIWSRQGQVELKTATKNPAPHPEVRSPAISKEVNISWLLRSMSDPSTLMPSFGIDRNAKACKTPRRNGETLKAFAHFQAIAHWTSYLADYINHLRDVQPKKLDDSTLSLENVFVPVAPIMFKDGIDEVEEATSGQLLAALAKPGAAAGLVLTASAGNLMLAEELRTLKEQRENILTAFPGDNGIFTCAEACMCLTLTHMRSITERWAHAVDYVESMLRKQLVAAIGKEVTPSEFASYMRFHYRKLFLDAYQPNQFCFAVRRSEVHGPEGTVSIEETHGDQSAPIVTLENHGSTPTAMNFPLNASTTISFEGPVHLHGWLCHSFSGQTGAQLSLRARARQFSSMLVLVGRVTSATSFDPTYAAIVQNKDELTVPLEMSVIPTPKEFKDAIASLSPEQQKFAKAFRAMQLESTLFGVLVVQIKPQLEKLLNLHDDSLTKEIKLTQDLMELFLKYQIPSDLLSFSEDSPELKTAPATARLAAVKGHVKNMYDMINQEKEQEIADKKQQALFQNPLQVETHLQSLVLCEEDAAPARRSVKQRARAAPAPPPVPSPPAAASGAAPPAPQSAKPAPKPAEPKAEPQVPKESQAGGGSGSSGTCTTRDYTQVPQEMDSQFEKLDPDSALRPTIINVGSAWKKRSQKALLAEPKESGLDSDEQKREKDAAFDLLDAITKSGALPLSHASLHIVIAATHCFDKTVVDTVVQDNVNPIEKVERSTLIMASTVHQQPVAALMNEASQQRVFNASPQLFLQDAKDAKDEA
ncbi:unnamed protein product [Effrenium voratum]|uniref:Uncharacterized protein n=1 Tax=Effrenium voratum TaxID=2562239 RepID=A0AA36ISP4_9DINO|nr:unnamed protein product [Effrenium voratum]CAJ1420715.1 unnamed protein product [Effrenium voratum]